MHSSTIRNYRCGISQGPLYRTVNENARRGGQARVPCVPGCKMRGTYGIGLGYAKGAYQYADFDS